MHVPDFIGVKFDGPQYPVKLHPDFITQGSAILAQRRKGKSNLMGVMMEIMAARRDPFVVLDPASAHWGIRYKHDSLGNPEGPSGFNVFIVGGEHGDVPLDYRKGAGKYLADTIVATDISVVIDMSDISEKNRKDFLVEFAEEILRKNRTPRHIFLEEADEFIPERTESKEEQAMRRVCVRLIKGGGGKGLGFTIVTQRPAMVSKTALFQIDNLFVLGMIGPPDIDVVKKWFGHNFSKTEAPKLEAIVSSLPTMQPGEAWFLSPQWLGELEHLQIRPRETYHAGRTPKRGERPVEVKHYEISDIARKFTEEMSSLAGADQAKIQSERELRSRVNQQEEVISRLRKELERKVAVPVGMPTPQVKALETSVVNLKQLVEDMLKIIVEHKVTIESDGEIAKQIFLEAQDLLENTHKVDKTYKEMIDRLHTRVSRELKQTPNVALLSGEPQKVEHRTVEPRGFERPITRTQERVIAGDGSLKPTAVKMLAALDGWPEGLRKGQLASFVGIKAATGNFSDRLRELRANGYASVNGDRVVLTDLGGKKLKEMGVTSFIPTTTAEVIQLWKSKLPDTAVRMLDVVMSHDDKYGISKQDLAAAAGIKMQTGNFSDRLRELRTAGLIKVEGGIVYPHRRNLLMDNAA